MKKPSSSAERKPYSACWSSRTRWNVWSLRTLPGWADGEDRRRREDPVADPADLDDQRIGGDGADDALDRCDHRVTRSL